VTVEENLALASFRKWDDVELKPGGAVRDVTKVRFWLGTHGPFERAFDRGVDAQTIASAIEDERNTLRRLSTA